jgi:hypothetical protein
MIPARRGGGSCAIVLALLLQGLASTANASFSATQEFDQLWTLRDDDAVAARLETRAQEFAASSDYEKLWRAASWYVWVATGDLPATARRAASLAGQAAGDRARQANPDGVEGKYWTALSVGLYASFVSQFEALGLGLDDRFRAPLQQAMESDPESQNPHLEWVGPVVALGAFYQHLPWPARNRSRARQLFERAVRSRPENLRAHFLLADLLKDEDLAAARRELQSVVDGDESYDPADAHRQKRRAAALLEQLR